MGIMKKEKLYFNFGNLRGKIKSKYKREEDFARDLGLARSSLSLKLNNVREFTPQEMIQACELLSIERHQISEYFFNTKV